MAYLDWYLNRKLDDRKRACALAWLLFPRLDLVEKIIVEAVHYVHTSARMHKRRTKKLALTELELLQIGILEAAGQQEQTILEAAGQQEQTIPLTPARYVIWYIKQLALCTLPRSSFFVAVGFGRILSNGSVRQILDLHSYLDPCQYLGSKEEKDVRKIAATLREQIYKKYQSIFQTNGQELILAETPKPARPDIHKILKQMILWETGCLPDTDTSYREAQHKRRGGARAFELERTRAHVYTDQEQCLERVRNWQNRSETSFENWRLPPGANSLDDESWMPPDIPDWDEFEKSIMEKIHFKEWQQQQAQKRAKKSRGQASAFEVVIDGEVKAFLHRGEHRSREIYLPASARYVEIRDRGSRTTVANCHLMDPQELPQKGWKSAVRLLSGEKVHFTLFPKLGGDDEEPGISMVVKRTASPLAYLSGVTELLGERGRRLAEFVRRVPAPAFGALLLALMLGAGYAAGRGPMLQQLNALIEQLGFDKKPFDVRFTAVGQRSLQLDLILNPDVVAEAFIDWDDPSRPDPVGGTRIYPGIGIPAGPNRLLLSPITHTYFQDNRVPPEGLRRTVRVHIVPTELPKVRPEPLREENLHPSRRIWVLPYGVVLDPPEAELRIVSPSAGEIVAPTTEVQIQAAALTADIHLLAFDVAHPEVYQYLGKLPPPPFGQEKTLTRVIDTSQLQAAGPFRLVALSSEQLTARVGDRMEWRDISQTAPRTEVEVRHAGVILAPRPGAVVSGIDTVRAQVFLANTYVAAVLCPAQAGGACWVQNTGQPVAPFVEFSRKVFYAGKDTYELFLGITYDPEFFKEGAPLAQRPLTDREGRRVYWVGPVPVEEQ
jgi:hypothetical protein